MTMKVENMNYRCLDFQTRKDGYTAFGVWNFFMFISTPVIHRSYNRLFSFWSVVF
jgi:hypothetical protein